MSEIRKTNTIRRVEAPPREPIITLADVLSAVGWLAVNGTILAVKGGVLACKEIRALSNSVRENRQGYLSTDDATRVVSQSADAQQAIAILSHYPNIEIPKARAELFRARLEKLAVTNDKAGTLTLARELLTARQDRLQTTLLTLAAETCREIGHLTGLTQVSALPGAGLVIAKSPDGRRTFTVNVEKTHDGGVQIHRDSDGFHGGSCVSAVHEPFDRVMRKKGAKCDSAERRRKHRRPVVQRDRVRQSNSCSTR